MRLLFVIDSLGFGGAERQLVELVKGLHKKGGYDIHMICLLPQDDGYMSIVQKFGIQVRVIERVNKFNLVQPIFKIRKYIRDENIELVHTFMNMGSLFGGIAAKLALVPVVCSAIRDAMDTSWKKKVIKRIIALYSNILVSNSLAGFQNRFKKMRPKYKVVYNGMDFSRFTSCLGAKQQLEKEFKLHEYSHVVCMVASLSDNKDHETLLKAIPEVLYRFPDVLFLIVGDGKNRSRIEQEIVESDIGKNVIVTGYRKDVDKIYQIMDLFVLLTNADIILEGISNALTEAMANRVPVLASEGGGTNEVIQNGKTGMLVPPKDPQFLAEMIVAFLSDKKKRTTFGKLASQSVRSKFGMTRYIDEYEQLYHSLN